MSTRAYLSTAEHTASIPMLVIQLTTPGAVPMSTPNTLASAPTLQQIHTHLLEIDPTLRPHSRRPVVLPKDRATLEQTSATLKRINGTFQTQARALYQGLDQVDLTQTAGKQKLSQLQSGLNKNLQTLNETSTVDGQSRKTYLTFTAGISALEHEARLNVSDYLLSPADLLMLEDCSRGPSFRPGLYALTFSYQEHTVAFAGAFVLTRKASPAIDSLSSTDPVGPVLLFTPSRGLEAFDSLHELDQGLQSAMATHTGRAEFNRHLPVRYQHLETLEIFPLNLQPIEGEPLFEHAYQALLDKRTQDIDFALSLAEDGQLNAAQLQQQLDNAVNAALPDLTSRLELRAQLLLERDLYHALPDWYRSAGDSQRNMLDLHLRNYNQARQAFMDLIGPASTPHALARYQWAEYLAYRWDIHDLDPDKLHITTRRTVAQAGAYVQQRSLVELTLRGLHTDDAKAGSAFLEHSTLSYAGAPLNEELSWITPQKLITPLQSLQPRLEFANVQKIALGTPQIKHAARSFFDQRLVTMAYLAKLQGHLSQADFQLFEQLRDTPRPGLCAQTVMFHGAQLKDLWLLREDDASGQAKRLLLCTPDAPSAQQFYSFSTERECQTHILGWLSDKPQADNRSMAGYVLEQVPLRFRPSMTAVIQGIGFKPGAEEHLKVTFGKPCNHTDCLDAMAAHRLALLLDDYELGAPAWYRSASAADRTRLTTLAEDAAGALHAYNARPDSEASFTTFESYLHEKAKRSLNLLLGRRQNDVDPDSIFVYSPKPLIGDGDKPVSYTTLYRDGYDDSIGFLNEKFSRSATFRGPTGIDLSALTTEKVERSVRGVWIGERYIDEVRQRLQNSSSPKYDERRNAVLTIQQLHMKSCALESRLRGHVASIDLAWLERAIDSLTDTAITVRNTYKVHRLFINGDWVIGNYLFSHADNPVLLYTPDAPDGIAFREAKLFNYLLKHVDGMLGYWRARVPLTSAARIGVFLQTAKNGLPQDINRTTPSPARHDGTSHISPLSDLRHEFYNMSLQRKIDDVQGTTVNRTQMITGILWTCIEWVTAVATMPFPLLSLTLGGLLAFKDAMLALNAYYQNDKGGALEHYIGYLANFGGAVLFDVRPALKGALKSLRPVIKPRPQAAQSAAIGRLDALTPENMQPALFNGRGLWTTKTPNSENIYVLYRLDAGTGQFHSTARLVKREGDRWVRPTVRGGTNGYESLINEQSSPLDDFDLTGDDATLLRDMLDPTFKENLPGMELGVPEAILHNFQAGTSFLRDAYSTRVAQLTQRAETFFQALPAPPPKAPVPVLAADAAHSDIVKTLFGRDKRLIIGTPKNQTSSLQLLIEQLPALVEGGLKRVYIEHLPRDLFQSKLKTLSNKRPGDKARALRTLKRQLDLADDNLGLSKEAAFTYSKLLDETQRLNVEMDGLDGCVSYHLEPVTSLLDSSRFSPRSSKLRNFYSHTLIEHNLSETPGEGWVALVTADRLGTYERVPGLAELQKTLALRVQNAAPGQPTGVWPDNTALGLSRGDYTLAVPTPPSALPAPTTSATPPVAATHFAEFDLPLAIHAPIEEIKHSRFGLDTHYVSAKPDLVAAQNQFSEIRQRLAGAAETAFTDFTPAPRAPLTQLSTQSEQVFIEQVYRQKTGLVIGESHIQQSAKQFLIDQMKQLKKQGVKTLYIEHLLTDLHQAALDTFYRTSKMPPSLKNYLVALDAGQMPGYKGAHTFTNVVKTANKYGIRVRALDCTASYHVKGIIGDMGRGELFNYFANEVIKADQLAEGAHKWVAFMGNSHTDMHRGVPGIVQLQDAVSLHVRDTFPAQAKRLRTGGWQSVGEHSIVALRSDFKIDVGNLKQPAPRRTPLPDRTRLTEAGHFFIERPSEFEVSLVHRSRSNEIITTAFQINDKGQYFIERWDALKNERFYDLTVLIEVLKAQPPRGLGLRQIT